VALVLPPVLPTLPVVVGAAVVGAAVVGPTVVGAPVVVGAAVVGAPVVVGAAVVVGPSVVGAFVTALQLRVPIVFAPLHPLPGPHEAQNGSVLSVHEVVGLLTWQVPSAGHETEVTRLSPLS